MHSITQADITALILAGGMGRRFDGMDKGLVRFNNKTMIEHVLKAISPQVSEVVINANRNIGVYKAFGKKVIRDDLTSFQGPLAGFAVAMQQVKTAYILSLPCDAPMVSSDYAARMMAALAENNEKDKQKDKSKKDLIVVAHDGERLQPVHALIPISLLPSLLSYLHSGERKIDRWYAMHTMRTADFSDSPELFINVNTQAQLKELEAS